jgi:hypothetical protein
VTMASNIADKISLPIAPSIASARHRPVRGALVTVKTPFAAISVSVNTP